MRLECTDSKRFYICTSANQVECGEIAKYLGWAMLEENQEAQAIAVAQCVKCFIILRHPVQAGYLRSLMLRLLRHCNQLHGPQVPNFDPVIAFQRFIRTLYATESD